MNKEQQERLTDQLGKQKTKQEELKTKVDAAKKAYEDEKKATGDNRGNFRNAILKINCHLCSTSRKRRQSGRNNRHPFPELLHLFTCRLTGFCKYIEFVVLYAISAGQDTADAVDFVRQSTKLATAGFAESGDTLDILTVCGSLTHYLRP